MTRSQIQTVPDYYQKYIDLVPDVNLLEVLPHGGLELFLNERNLLQEIGLKVYAPEKWTINQIIEHLMDTELIFLNRALRFARKDTTNLPGYEENYFAETARSNERSLEDLLENYQLIRACSTYFYKSLNEEQLLATGTANNQLISVLAVGFIIIGHPIHHFNTIKERYAPLVV
jgi:hypothetical protein